MHAPQPISRVCAVLAVFLVIALLPPLTVSANTANGCPNTGPVGQCVQVLSDQYWKLWSTGVPTQRLVTRPGSSLPWGSVIPGTRAQWVYAGDFNTGSIRDPNQWTVIRFERFLGPADPSGATVPQSFLARC